MPDTKQALQLALDALNGAIRHIEVNTCRHDDTYRGGAIWTICRGCGAKWADDRDGFKPYKEPKELTEAYAAVDALQSALQQQETREPVAVNAQHPLDRLLPEICQLLDVCREDFMQRNLWTEWDQSVRDRITAYYLGKQKTAAIIGDPRHSMRTRPLTDEQIDTLYAEKIAQAHFAGKQGVMRGIVRAVEEAHGIAGVSVPQQDADALDGQVQIPLSDAQMLLAWMDETFGNDNGTDWHDEEAAAIGDALNSAIESFKNMRAAMRAGQEGEARDANQGEKK